MEIIFLTVEEVIYIQSEILTNALVTDIGKLESAIKRAEQIITTKALIILLILLQFISSE